LFKAIQRLLETADKRGARRSRSLKTRRLEHVHFLMQVPIEESVVDVHLA
jgi:hypothetical protein